MAGDFAAEDGLRLTHPRLEEGVADAIHERGAAVAGHGVLDRVAGAHVIDDRLPRLLDQERLGQQGGDEVARHEGARSVDEEAPVGIASQAIPISAPSATTRSTMCRRFSSMSGFAS